MGYNVITPQQRLQQFASRNPELAPAAKVFQEALADGKVTADEAFSRALPALTAAAGRSSFSEMMNIVGDALDASEVGPSTKKPFVELANVARSFRLDYHSRLTPQAALEAKATAQTYLGKSIVELLSSSKPVFPPGAAFRAYDGPMGRILESSRVDAANTPIVQLQFEKLGVIVSAERGNPVSKVTVVHEKGSELSTTDVEPHGTGLKLAYTSAPGSSPMTRTVEYYAKDGTRLSQEIP